MNRKPWRTREPLAIALLVALLAGCGDGRPKRVPVSGRVLIDGRPLEVGSVCLYPADHRMAMANIQGDGHFMLSTYELGDGCVTGRHPVSVNASKLINQQTMRWFAPKKYAGADTSGLEYEITGPTEDLQIQLTWGGGKPFNERIQGGGD
jgi:hypothetical protein